LAKKIEGCDCFLYFLTQSSANSEHCQRELNFAQDEKKKVIAVLLESFDLPSGLRLSLRNRQIINRFGLSGREYHTRLASALSRDSEPIHPVPDSGTEAKTIGWPKWAILALVVAVVCAAAFLLDQNQRAPTTRSAKVQATTPSPEEEQPASAQRPSIAVLPFDNLSNDPDQDYFVDGMTEEIITKLSMNSALAVIARNSTFFYKGKKIRIKQIAEELGVRYIVEGSVRKAAGNVRITAQLIDAETENHIWSKAYNRELKNIITLQSEIAQHVASALNVKFEEAELQRSRRIPTQNMTAYEYALRGLEHYPRQTTDDFHRAETFLERSIELDRDFNLPYVWLGRAYIWQYCLDGDPEKIERAAEYAEKAMALDSSYYMVHALYAEIYLYGHAPLEKATIAIERAISLNPNEPDSYRIKGEILAAVQRPEESIEAIRKGISLHPHNNRDLLNALALPYLQTGQYRKAIAALNEAITLSPSYNTSWRLLVLPYLWMWITQQSDDPQVLDRALVAAEKASISGDGSSLELLCWVHLYRKSISQAIVCSEKLTAASYRSTSSYVLLADLHTILGEPEKAVEMANEAFQLVEVPPALHFVILGNAKLSSGRPMEAIEAYRRALSQQKAYYSDKYHAHLQLSIAYIELDLIEEARSHAAEVLRLVPRFSVDVWGERNPMKDRQQVERDMAALRKAGLR